MGAFCLDEGRVLRSTDQEDGRCLCVRQRFQCFLIEFTLRLQACERSETRSSANIRVDESRPSRRQLQQSKSMPSGSGIEDHVVKLSCRTSVAQQLGKLVKGSDFDRARTRKLLFDVLHRRFRKKLAIGPNHSLTVLSCGLFGVNIHCKEAFHFPDGSGVHTQCCFQNLVQVRSRISADQEDALTAFSQKHGSCAGNGCLAYAALAREHEISCGIPKRFHASPSADLAW